MDGSSSVTLGILSDTHGWLDPALAEIFVQQADMIVHAGDIGRRDVLDRLEAIAPTRAVRGNIDGPEFDDLPLEHIETIAGHSVALLHIAGSPKRPKRAARDLIARESPDILIVGHSHIPVVGRRESTLWINPGAAGRQGFHAERFAALLTLTPEASPALSRIELGPRSRTLPGPAS